MAEAATSHELLRSERHVRVHGSVGGARDAGAMDDGDLLEITCPRCAATVREAFYGPCSACRTELRATLGGERRDVVAATYEPKMNVTPNAVASKD